MAVLDTSWVNWRWGLLLMVFVLFIGACGGSDSPESTATRVAPAPTTASSNGGAANNPTPARQATQTPQATATQTSSSGGGGTLDLDEALDQVIIVYEELLDQLAGVTDEASARAAVDDVTRLLNQLEDINKRLGDYSDAEIANAALSGRIRSLGQQLGNELIRLSANPAAFALLAEAFENLIVN